MNAPVPAQKSATRKRGGGGAAVDIKKQAVCGYARATILFIHACVSPVLSILGIRRTYWVRTHTCSSALVACVLRTLCARHVCVMMWHWHQNSCRDTMRNGRGDGRECVRVFLRL
jgi:hypothetical protein